MKILHWFKQWIKNRYHFYDDIDLFNLKKSWQYDYEDQLLYWKIIYASKNKKKTLTLRLDEYSNLKKTPTLVSQIMINKGKECLFGIKIVTIPGYFKYMDNEK